MLCAIYKSSKKTETYLYVEKRDDFSKVPAPLLASFGRPSFVLMFNLAGNKPLVNAEKEKVLQEVQDKGFYLQLPPRQENLLAVHRNQQGEERGDL